MGMAWCCLIVTYTGVWTGGWAGGSSDERVARHGVDEGTGMDELRRRASGTGEDGRMAWMTMRAQNAGSWEEGTGMAWARTNRGWDKAWSDGLHGLADGTGVNEAGWGWNGWAQRDGWHGQDQWPANEGGRWGWHGVASS